MTRDKLLKIMISTFCSCMNPGYPISIRNIAYNEKETYYQVRKYMKQLESEGLVKKKVFIIQEIIITNMVVMKVKDV